MPDPFRGFEHELFEILGAFLLQAIELLIVGTVGALYCIRILSHGIL